MQRTALLLGRERNWRLRVRLGSGSCSSETGGVPAGGGDADEGISGEDAETQADRSHTE